MTTKATKTTEQTLTTSGVVEGFVTVKLVSPTGEETIDVPTAIAGNDDLLKGLLADSGVSMAANALIERAADGAITLTKQADRNG